MCAGADSLLNFLEGKAEAVEMLFRKLKDCPDLTDVKVLTCSEDCPKRYFSDWDVRSIKLDAEPDVSIEG